MTRTVRALSVVGGLACSVTAVAQSPQRTKRAAATAPASPYLAGNQPLLGAHVASDTPAARDAFGRPMLSLRSMNRGEILSIPASGDNGGFNAADLDRVAHLLRAAGGDEHPVDPRILGIVYRIQTHFAVPEIRIVSGYRVPRPKSRSNHGTGRAMDLIVPGVVDEDVARFVREIGFVGVGVYPRSQFVHVDIRPRSYFWVDSSGPHMKNRERGILGDVASHNDTAATARGEAPIEPFVIGTDVSAALSFRGARTTTVGGDEDEDPEN